MSKDVERDKKCGIRLQNALNECRVEQKEMAADLHYAPTYISDLCTGKRHISEKAAKKFADYLSKKHEPQTSISFVSFFSPNDQKKLAIDGYSSGDIIETKTDYYDYNYFTGELDTPNFDMYMALKAKSEDTATEELTLACKTFLSRLGFAISASDSFFSLLANPETCGGIRSFRIMSKLKPDKNSATLRKASTGEEIKLSLYESAVLLDTLRHSAIAILDGLFLSRSADDGKSENVPDLGKT